MRLQVIWYKYRLPSNQVTASNFRFWRSWMSTTKSLYVCWFLNVPQCGNWGQCATMLVSAFPLALTSPLHIDPDHEGFYGCIKSRRCHWDALVMCCCWSKFENWVTCSYCLKFNLDNNIQKNVEIIVLEVNELTQVKGMVLTLHWLLFRMSCRSIQHPTMYTGFGTVLRCIKNLEKLQEVAPTLWNSLSLCKLSTMNERPNF